VRSVQGAHNVSQSVRGAIYGPDIGVVSAIIVKQGEADILGLTDSVIPKRESLLTRYGRPLTAHFQDSDQSEQPVSDDSSTSTKRTTSDRS